jgi:hypothetical protein
LWRSHGSRNLLHHVGDVEDVWGRSTASVGNPDARSGLAGDLPAVSEGSVTGVGIYSSLPEFPNQFCAPWARPTAANAEATGAQTRTTRRAQPRRGEAQAQACLDKASYRPQHRVRSRFCFRRFCRTEGVRGGRLDAMTLAGSPGKAGVMGKKVQLQVFRRDGWMCRRCLGTRATATSRQWKLTVPSVL